MRTITLVLVLVGCGSSTPPFHPERSGAPQLAPAAEWERLTSRLLGEWEATVPTGTVIASYRLVSNDSALVETFRTPSGRETISIYHLDGERLLMTHYCGQTNQPRLMATHADATTLKFDLMGVTGYQPSESVMRSLSISFGSQAFDQASTYRSPTGELEEEILHFVRTPRNPA